MLTNSYLKFLVASHKLLSEFSGDEKLVLEEVFKRGSEHPYRVQEIISMRSIASQATIHKVLSHLITRGFLNLKTSKEDGRVKFVLLSKKSEKIVEQLNALLQKSTT